MSGSFRKIVTGALVFLCICALAVMGYLAAGWNLSDATYMVVITIFGVGYGEVHPVDSNFLRGLTISVIVTGYASLIYTMGGFVQMLIDGEINNLLGVRRMNKELERLQEHTIICGIGRLGSSLASDIAAAGKPFVIVDQNLERLNEARGKGYLVIHGDATEEEVLAQAGLARATTLATVLSNDANNVFVTITARGMNPDVMIIARGENPRTEKKLLSSGADKVVLPTAIGAQKIAQLIIRPAAETLLGKIAHENLVQDELGRIGLRFDELTVAHGSPLVDHAIGNIEVRGNHGFLIVGIRRADGQTTLDPPSETRLSAGDVVIVLGRANDIPELSRRYFAQSSKISYRGASHPG